MSIKFSNLFVLLWFQYHLMCTSHNISSDQLIDILGYNTSHFDYSKHYDYNFNINYRDYPSEEYIEPKENFNTSKNHVNNYRNGDRNESFELSKLELKDKILKENAYNWPQFKDHNGNLTETLIESYHNESKNKNNKDVENFGQIDIPNYLMLPHLQSEFDPLPFSKPSSLIESPFANRLTEAEFLWQMTYANIEVCRTGCDQDLVSK